MQTFQMTEAQWSQINSALCTAVGVTSVHAREVHDQMLKAAIAMDDIVDSAEKSPFTVIVMHPDYADQSDNGFNGTFQAHVMAVDAADAIDEAAMQAAAATGRAIGEDAALSDWSAIACFPGHLDSLHGEP